MKLGARRVRNVEFIISHAVAFAEQDLSSSGNQNRATKAFDLQIGFHIGINLSFKRATIWRAAFWQLGLPGDRMSQNQENKAQPID